MKNKKCKVCSKSFAPTQPLQRVCGVSCAIEYNHRVDAKRAEKGRKKALQQRKVALRPKREWLRLTQVEFNKYIRARDADLPCISCGRHHTGQYHAGHYRTTAAQPALRFNEINCHKQCMPCNTHKSGNITEYRINLANKIGNNLVDWLEIDHPRTEAWTVPELEALRKYYREATKQLCASA